MNIYQQHSDRELAVVLEQSKKLTYDAKLNLLKELARRDIPVAAHLNEQIASKELEIDQLVHLPDLGFDYSIEDGNTILIQRTFWAKLMDLAAIVLGTLLFIVGLIHLWLLLLIFFGDNAFTLTKLFTYTLLIVLGGIGYGMLSGIHRFLDHLNFKLTKTGDTIQLTRGYPVKEQRFDSAAVHIAMEEEEMTLMIGEEVIVTANPSQLVQRKTVMALLEKMQTNG